MTMEIGVDIGEGRQWYAASDSFSHRGGAVVVPVDTVDDMTDAEIAAAVRRVASWVPFIRAENTAQWLLSHGNTVRSMRNTPNPEKYINELAPFTHLSDEIRLAYKLLVEVQVTRNLPKKHVPTERKVVAANYDRLFVSVGRRDGFWCAACRGCNDLELDHVLPVSLGGSSGLDNLQLLCAPCNNQKGATYVDFRTCTTFEQD